MCRNSEKCCKKPSGEHVICQGVHGEAEVDDPGPGPDPDLLNSCCRGTATPGSRRMEHRERSCCSTPIDATFISDFLEVNEDNTGVVAGRKAYIKQVLREDGINKLKQCLKPLEDLMGHGNLFSSLSTDAARLLFFSKCCLNWKIGLLVATAHRKEWDEQSLRYLHEAAKQLSSSKINFGLFEHSNILPSKCKWKKDG